MLEDSSSISELMPPYCFLYLLMQHLSHSFVICFVLVSIGIAASVHHRVKP